VDEARVLGAATPAIEILFRHSSSVVIVRPRTTPPRPRRTSRITVRLPQFEPVILRIDD